MAVEGAQAGVCARTDDETREAERSPHDDA